MKTLIITGYGINCDYETEYALNVVGANPKRIHINEIKEKPKMIHDFQMVVIPGGFSFGDDIESGRVLAMEMRLGFDEELQKFINDEKLVLGICNGAQVMVKYPLLPRFDDNYYEGVSLVTNASAIFGDRWIRLKVNPNSPCIFTKGIDFIELPVRHGEGRFVFDPSNPSLLSEVKKNNMIAIQYVDASGEPTMDFPANPNGSTEAIAGMCDKTGRLFAIMPHPEGLNTTTNHPNWTKKKEIYRRAGLKFPVVEGEGIKMFRNAVSYSEREGI